MSSRAPVRRKLEREPAPRLGNQVDSLMLMYTPESEMRPAYEMGALGFDEVYRGREGIREFSRRWSEAWGRGAMRPTELLDGGDTIVFRYRMDVEGRGSGVVTGQHAIFVFRLKERDGRVAWSSFFIDPAEASNAAGFPV